MSASYAAPVFQIGSDKLTRADFAQVGCYNFVAAVRLSAILKDIGAKSLRHVFDTIPPSALAVPGLGVISLAVLGAAFEAAGVGGATPLEAYAVKHAEKDGKGRPDVVTFSTLKQHAHNIAARDRGVRRRPKARR